MKYLLFYIIALWLNIFPSEAQQAFSGKVLNDESGQPIPGASIYINNTSVGTLSNTSGEFHIPDIIEGELIISSVGFERIIYKLNKNELGQRSFTFRLQPKQELLQDVMVMPDATRRRFLSIFRDHFLGITEEADMSKVTNLDAIYFVKPAGDKDGIIALSDTPLTIINRKLGYKIEFDLAEFYINEKVNRTYFYGFTRYNEMGDKKKWVKNRRKAYYGSTVHFFRSLINDQLEQEGYSIYKILGDTSTKKPGGQVTISSRGMDIAIAAKASDIIKKDSNDIYSASWGKKLMVQYHKKPAGKTYLSQKTMVTGALPNGFRSYLHTEEKVIRIDGNGLLLDPLKVFFSGYWIYEKAANLLPYNYIPEKED